MHNQVEFAKRIIELSNELIKYDPSLGNEMFSVGWQCGNWAVEHADVTVDKERNIIRLIGFLNGLAGAKPDGTPFIRAIYKKDGKIIKLELNDNGKPQPVKSA